MVRINLINPKALADQHLIAEYNEILKFLGYVKKFPKLNEQPCRYCLGKGHIIFFKNKLKYIKKRFNRIKKEMKQRGFKARKKIDLEQFPKELRKNWKPDVKDKDIIKKRLIKKLKIKPDYYLYYGEKKDLKFFLNLLKKY
ncbi:MAG: pyrimidine dimer DNA glycosylase/endonuclease V [archaeon]